MPECVCGHPWSDHGFVPGVKMGVAADGSYVDDGHGGVLQSLPDVWVCGGGREVPDADEDTSPWEFVCGCVLKSPPPGSNAEPEGEASSSPVEEGTGAGERCPSCDSRFIGHRKVLAYMPSANVVCDHVWHDQSNRIEAVGEAEGPNPNKSKSSPSLGIGTVSMPLEEPNPKVIRNDWPVEGTDEGRERLRGLIADMLAYNDDCGPGPVSRQEYLDDANALLDLIEREAPLWGEASEKTVAELEEQVSRLPRLEYLVRRDREELQEARERIAGLEEALREAAVMLEEGAKCMYQAGGGGYTEGELRRAGQAARAALEGGERA